MRIEPQTGIGKLSHISAADIDHAHIFQPLNNCCGVAGGRSISQYFRSSCGDLSGNIKQILG
jgi:hypothetical protein